MGNIVEQWMERVRYDLSSAKAMLKARKYLYAAFMCQQAVEKAMKAFLAKQCSEIPFTHNLRKIAEVSSLEDEMDTDQLDFLERLTPFAIKARYGSYKSSLSEICSAKMAKSLVSETERFLKWLGKKI